MKPKSMCNCMWQWKSVNPRIVRNEIHSRSTAAANADHILHRLGFVEPRELRRPYSLSGRVPLGDDMIAPVGRHRSYDTEKSRLIYATANGFKFSLTRAIGVV